MRPSGTPQLPMLITFQSNTAIEQRLISDGPTGRGAIEASRGLDVIVTTAPNAADYVRTLDAPLTLPLQLSCHFQLKTSVRIR